MGRHPPQGRPGGRRGIDRQGRQGGPGRVRSAGLRPRRGRGDLGPSLLRPGISTRAVSGRPAARRGGDPLVVRRRGDRPGLPRRPRSLADPARRSCSLGRVTFAWHRPGTTGSSQGRQSIALPTPDPSGPFDADLRSTAPTTFRIEVGRRGGFERIGRAGWEVEDVEQLARKVVESLGNLDRSSRRDREAILDDLTEIELRGRQFPAVPSEQAGTLPRPQPRPTRRSQGELHVGPEPDRRSQPGRRPR